MPELHTVVCMKVVPKPEEVRVNPQTRLLDRANARSEMNPPDMNALEIALQLKDRYGGRVSVISMGPPYFEPVLRVALAMGADELYLLSDRRFAGADTLATTYTLAQGIRKLGSVDLILCGEESSDGATGQVPPGLAEWLDVAQLTLATQLDVDLNSRLVFGRRALPGGYEELQVPLPCVASVRTASNEPRFMDYRIKQQVMHEAPITVWSVEDLGAEQAMIGLQGSPTMVSGLAQAPSQERKRIFIEGSTEEIVNQLLILLQEAP
jgi:electron transfer flavoprotein beta subunit